MSDEVYVPPSALYEKIANILREEIEGGRFEVGERLPSARDIAASHDVGHMTAAQALRALEDEGFLASKKRSGFFVRPRNEWGVVVRKTPTLEDLASQVAELQQQLGDVLARLSSVEALLAKSINA